MRLLKEPILYRNEGIGLSIWRLRQLKLNFNLFFINKEQACLDTKYCVKCQSIHFMSYAVNLQTKYKEFIKIAIAVIISNSPTKPYSSVNY